MDEQARVLLTGREEHGASRARSIEQDRERVGQAGRDVDVGDADLTRGLGVPVGGGHDRGLLEPDDVVERRAVERIQERQLRGAGVSEEVAHAGRAERGDQRGGSVHAREDTTACWFAFSASRPA